METKKTSAKESIFTPKKTVKFFIISVVGYTVVAMILWPLLELLFTKIDGSTYNWTIINGVVEPLIFGIVVTIIDFLFWNFFHKKR